MHLKKFFATIKSQNKDERRPYTQGQNYNPYTGAPLSGIDPPAGYPQKSRIAAGLFGMLMGTFGVHNFYLGNTQRGLIQILVATLGAPLTCGLSTVAVWVWSLVEGVQILEGKIKMDANGIKLKD